MTKIAQPTPKEHINILAKNTLIALEEFSSLNQEKFDNIVREMALAGLEKQRNMYGIPSSIKKQLELLKIMKSSSLPDYVLW